MPLHENERDTLRAKRENRGAPDGAAPSSPTDLESTKKATLKRTFTEFQADNITDWAASLTYYGILAVFPALLALVSIVGLVGDSAVNEVQKNIDKITPGPAQDILSSAVSNIAGSPGQAGIAFIIGLLLALNSASGYIAAFTRASNAIYKVQEGRPVWKLKPQQIGIVLVLILMLVIVLVGVVLTGPVAKQAGKVIGVNSDGALLAWDLAKIPVILLVVSAMFAFLFKAAPNVKQPNVKFFSPGGVVALLLFVLVTALFALYLATFASYSKTYGSFGAIIAFLTWVWLVNVAILFGAEFNAELQRSQQIEAGQSTSLDEPFLEPRDVSKLEKKEQKDEEERGVHERRESDDASGGPSAAPDDEKTGASEPPAESEGRPDSRVHPLSDDLD